jgi:hypothetical protein
MPAAKKLTRQPRTSAAVRTQAEDQARRLEHISASIEAAQKDLAAIGRSLSTGVRDVGRDVNGLLRDTRRDLLKMRRAVQRDIERLQHDLTAAATAKPTASRRAPTKAAKSARRQRAATSH